MIWEKERSIMRLTEMLIVVGLSTVSITYAFATHAISKPGAVVWESPFTYEIVGSILATDLCQK